MVYRVQSGEPALCVSGCLRKSMCRWGQIVFFGGGVEGLSKEPLAETGWNLHVYR